MMEGYLLAMIDNYRRESSNCKPELRGMYYRIIKDLETLISLSGPKVKHFKEEQK